MLISQAVIWMPIVRCDSCGIEVPTRDAIPSVNGDGFSGQYQLAFFCSKTCKNIGCDLAVVERDPKLTWRNAK
ncbi:MAG: hypothetical protein M0R17_01745 [Candidatus Omnitrophica bacterium]|jgi:hypothetical protein|nr:hypothetical protein [Candidatus Omnitrophota bacterium]